MLAEHKPAGFLESHLLLELQGAHRGDSLEVVMETRDAHAEFSRDIVDPKRLVELLTKPLDSPDDAVGVATQERNVTKPVTLCSHQQPVDNFPRDQRREDPSFGRGVQEPDEPHYGVQQACIQRAYVHGLHVGMASRRDVRGRPQP